MPHTAAPRTAAPRTAAPRTAAVRATRVRPVPALLLLVLLLLAGLPVVEASAAGPVVERVSGADRYATAAAVSAARFPSGAEVAYVATGASFPDALAGGAAAAAGGAPVLLVEPSAVPSPTADELRRLAPRRIVVLGGPGAVADGVLAALRPLTVGTVTRLAGPDRYATAAAVSAATFSPGVPDVHVTTGTGFADALAAGPAAAAADSPVLLVDPGRLPDATAAELARLRPTRITVVGGASSVWPAVEDQLRRVAPVVRVFGPDRAATSAAVSRRAFPRGAPTVVLATGASAADALAGGPAAALGGGPLLLVTRDCVPAPVVAELARLAPGRVLLLGGAGAVSSAVERLVPCPGPAAPTGPVAGGPERSLVLESPDYASEVHADPWDYSNAADVHTGTPQMSDAGTIAGGLLTYTTATPYPWMDPVPYLPGSMPLERDGPRAHIDTSRYTSVSVRMHASAAGAGTFVWSTCDWSRDRACQGATGVAVQAGWRTYEVPLRPTDRNFTAPWSGRALQLRFIPTGASGTVVRVDWMRLHGAAAPVRFDVVPAQAGAGNEVFWDSNADPADNTPDRPGWGPLGTTSGTTADFPVAAYPPGTYRLYTRAAGRTGPYTEPLQVLPRTRPVVDSPSLAGGADYATTVRRNPWDFADLDDVGRNANVCGARVVSGVLAARNCGPEIDNPYFFLPTAGSVDGSTWHRLTLRIRYDGVFGLTGGPTGGAVARLVWYVAGTPGADQNVHDLVLYPGWQTITVDLSTDPPVAVTDETQKARRVGWAGQTITALRLDPNEDVSERRWYVDSVRLTKVDAGRGRFDLRFRETSGVAGSTARVFLDRDRTGADGTRVATAAVERGTNTVPMTLPVGLPAGRYWPYVVVTGPGGTSTRYADAPVDLSS